MKQFFKNLTKADRYILFVSTLLVLVCLFLLSPYGDELIFNDFFDEIKSAELGKISYLQNDTRHKKSGQMFWAPAKMKRSVRSGESIFSGQGSGVNVDMIDGSKVMIGENSLIRFEKIQQEKMANLKFGNFNVKVEGEMKIAINGEVSSISGKNSEIQVFIGTNNKPQIRLLKGEATIKSKSMPNPKKLKAREVASLPVNKNNNSNGAPTRNQTLSEQKPSEKPTPSFSQPTPQATSVDLAYIWKLHDLYENKENLIFEKKYQPLAVSMNHTLSWTYSPENPLKSQDAYIQLSRSSAFTNPQSLKTQESSIKLNQVFVGENFWKVSPDEKLWSSSAQFRVNPIFLAGAEPNITAPIEKIPLLGPQVKIPIQLTTSLSGPLGFLVQASTVNNFAPESTKIFWSSQNNFNLTFYKPGSYYYRFKTVSANRELSLWSKPVVFNVFSPEAPLAPKLAKGTKEVYVGNLVKLAWKSEGIKTRIEISDTSGKKINEFVADKITWQANKPGRYQARAWTVNAYGQESPPSNSFSFQVKPRVLEQRLEKVAKNEPKSEIVSAKKPETRKTASVENSNSVRLEQPPPLIVNEKYKSSQISANGFLWSLFSSEQYYSGENSPIASGFGVHGYWWLGSHGFEGSLKTGVSSLNGAGSSQSLKDVELRYHYRFFTGSPWRYSRELQISLFGGIESYRNSGGSFVSQYDLMKFGTSLEFPWSSKWSTGGEFVYGVGSDNSQKKEISGNLNYFFDPNWSMGMGYRIHLFDAGSPSSTPRGDMPYREGYTEGFSVLNYHF